MTKEPIFGADDLVNALANSLRDRDHALRTAPALLRRTLETGAWRDFHTPLKEHITHERFSDFVTMDPFEGLGTTVDLIRRIVADNTATLDLLDQALQQKPGDWSTKDSILYNIQDSKAPSGTSETAALRRLRKDRPDLHAEVLAGNLTAHAAMVQANFRPRTFTVRPDPESAARTIRKYMTTEQCTELALLLIPYRIDDLDAWLKARRMKPGE